jgi:hypothetical protein
MRYFVVKGPNGYGIEAYREGITEPRDPAKPDGWQRVVTPQGPIFTHTPSTLTHEEATALCDCLTPQP